MSNRCAFLKQSSVLSVLVSVLLGVAGSAMGSSPSAGVATAEHQGWKPTWIKQADGNGGWVLRPAQIQFLHYGDGKRPYDDHKSIHFIPFGVQQMDTDEIALIGAIDNKDSRGWPHNQKPVIAFSEDRGNTWTPLKMIDESDTCYGRTMVFTYLGKGELTFLTEAEPSVQYFSYDYGRTWPDRQPLQPPTHDEISHLWYEGSSLVDRDAGGVAQRIASIGYNIRKGSQDRHSTPICLLRWSKDGGKTWFNETASKSWVWQNEYQGQAYWQGTNEGSIVRGANGWLVAALRINRPLEFRVQQATDNLNGMGVSVSKDNGANWSAVQTLYRAGRMHTHLLVLPDGEIVLTYIERQDIQNGQLASYRRGAGAVVSYDNGLTWDTAHRYLLGDFEFADQTPYALACGHQWSALLDDGHILTVYGHYPSKGACLVKWKPTLRQ